MEIKDYKKFCEQLDIMKGHTLNLAKSLPRNKETDKLTLELQDCYNAEELISLLGKTLVLYFDFLEKAR